MNSSILQHLSLEDFGLQPENISFLSERILLVKKFNWDYGLAHKFQRHSLKLLDQYPQIRIIICCSHPRCFTNGRGLQKPRKGEVLNLVEFNPALAGGLPFPFFQIERGGGLTFHHPGQMIIYPIARLNPKGLSLSLMINDLFDFAISVLDRWGIKDLSHENKLLGLWHKEKKLASMGIAIEKLTTFHGMALNFYKDEEMKEALRLVNPCGLNSETYISVEELKDLSGPENLESFSEQFLDRLKTGWS